MSRAIAMPAAPPAFRTRDRLVSGISADPPFISEWNDATAAIMVNAGRPINMPRESVGAGIDARR